MITCAFGKNTKACPFCGRMPQATGRWGEYRIGCEYCAISFSSTTLSAAVRRWNRRTTARMTKRDLKALHKLLAATIPELDPIQDRII